MRTMPTGGPCGVGRNTYSCAISCSGARWWLPQWGKLPVEVLSTPWPPALGENSGESGGRPQAPGTGVSVYFALRPKMKGVAPLSEATPSLPVFRLCCCTCPFPNVYWALPCFRSPCPLISRRTICRDGSWHTRRRPSLSASTSATPSSWGEWPPGTSEPGSSRPKR
jgi:hypothetical protein